MALTVLLIDSDVSHAHALQFYLAQKHLDVLVAGTGEAARELLAGPSADILLANPYGLENGFAAELKQFKKMAALPPLIVFVPRESLDQAMDDFGLLAINFLEIPLNSKALALALRRAEAHLSTEKKLVNYSQRLSDLHNAQILYHQLFNEVPCYITVQNKDLRLTNANLKFQKDFGHAVGGYCYEIYKHRRSPCPECPVVKTFADGESHGTEEVVTSQSGKQYNVIIQTAPIRDQNGEITQVMEISTNITNIRRLQDHLSSLGLMLGAISHGIKGMLTGLDSSIYQLGTGLEKKDHKRVRNGFSQIKEISQGIKKTVLDILNYAKSRELQYEKVGVAELAETVLSMVGQQARDQGVRLEKDIPESIGTVEIDPNWIRAALVNLLENAVDACKGDTASKDHYIKLAARDHGEKAVCLLVADNGMGMSPQTRERLFTLFFTSKGAQGTGLGLFIANQVVAQHGGTITVSSVPGEGTCFVVCLPREKTESSDDGFSPGAYNRVTF